MLGWHFTADRLRDGRPLPAVGETLVHDGPVEICRLGLHGSERIIAALNYAPGPIVSYCRFEGIEDRQEDKFVCRRRTVLWRLDATDVLRADARESAKSVLHLWDAPEVVRRYLDTGDDGLMATARAAAWAAAEAAAWSAARAAAGSAARAAAWAAAGSAARAAAEDAARAAARAAAWAAAGSAARAAAEDAARYAARAAGQAAAWSAAEVSARAAAEAWSAAEAARNDRLTAAIIAEAKRLGVYEP